MVQKATLTHQKQRSMLVFVGEQQWLNKQVLEICDNSTYSAPLLFSEDESTLNLKSIRINTKNYRQQLGLEHSFIVFDASANFNVDAFAALTGTLVAGGILVLLLPQENLKQSAFVQRFYDYALNTENIHIINESDCQTEAESIADVIKQADKSLLGDVEQHRTVEAKFTYHAKTSDQQQAVEHILKVATGHRDRPLVITADRGRGKSTSLALACIKLLAAGEKSIIVTAPHPNAVSVVFEHLKRLFPQADHLHHKVSYLKASLCFVPLDELIKNTPKCHVLLVDEAAGIPINILINLLNDYHRSVFVSTVHGYEGAGRGFSGKFLQHLKRKKPNSNLYHMQQPIRWSVNDPLEHFTFSALMLNAKLRKVDDSDLDQLVFQSLNNKQLSQCADLLEQIFALLVTAHYQTKPSDLKMLLDDPSISVVVAKQQDHVLGVALLLTEGNIEGQIANQIQQSERRIKGHFLPQSLLIHNGIKDAFDYRYQRIIRIAVHPQQQAKGLGSQLLNKCEQRAQQLGLDFIGSSFGANAQLLRFWQTNNYSVARLGFTKDASSGEHSALVLKSISDHADKLNNRLRTNFQQDFVFLLADEYALLATDLVRQVFIDFNVNSTLSDFDKQALSDFVSGYRQWSNCAPAIGRNLPLLLNNINGTKRQLNIELNVLIRRVLQKHQYQDIAKEFNLSGKKLIIQTLKKAVKILLDKYQYS